MALYQAESDIFYHGDVVLFDLDDTLYPEEEYLFSGFKAVARSLQACPPATATSRRFSAEELMSIMREAYQRGENAFDAVADAMSLAGDRAQKEIESMVAIYRGHEPEIALPEESRAILDYLSAHGLRTGLITDGRPVAQRAKIRALKIDPYFAPENIYISGERGHDKRDIEPFAWFVHRYPEAKRFFYVGDNPEKDFFYPNLMGWTSICLLSKGRNIHPQNFHLSEEKNPRLKIEHLSQLKEILENNH